MLNEPQSEAGFYRMKNQNIKAGNGDLKIEGPQTDSMKPPF